MHYQFAKEQSKMKAIFSLNSLAPNIDVDMRIIFNEFSLG